MEKRVYLAGKQNGGEGLIADFSEELELNGHVVVEKWWEKGILPKPYLDQLDTSAPAATAMIDAASDSDVFVLFAEDTIFGAAVELGAALGSVQNNSDKEIYLLKPSEVFRQSIFYGHPAVIAIESLDHIRKTTWFKKS